MPFSRSSAVEGLLDCNDTRWIARSSSSLMGQVRRHRIRGCSTGRSCSERSARLKLSTTPTSGSTTGADRCSPEGVKDSSATPWRASSFDWQEHGRTSRLPSGAGGGSGAQWSAWGFRSVGRVTRRRCEIRCCETYARQSSSFRALAIHFVLSMSTHRERDDAARR